MIKTCLRNSYDVVAHWQLGVEVDARTLDGSMTVESIMMRLSSTLRRLRLRSRAEPHDLRLAGVQL